MQDTFAHWDHPQANIHARLVLMEVIEKAWTILVNASLAQLDTTVRLQQWILSHLQLAIISLTKESEILLLLWYALQSSIVQTQLWLHIRVTSVNLVTIAQLEVLQLLSNRVQREPILTVTRYLTLLSVFPVQEDLNAGLQLHHPMEISLIAQQISIVLWLQKHQAPSFVLQALIPYKRILSL